MKKSFILFLSGFMLMGMVKAQGQSNGPMGVERIARFTSLGYQSKPGKDGQPKWVQVDLGRIQKIDSIKLYPFLAGYDIQPRGFPCGLVWRLPMIRISKSL